MSHICDITSMNYEIVVTNTFAKWHQNLKDRQAFKAISNRLLRAEAGNLGDIKNVGNGISEMRIFVGAGYRVYFTIRQQLLIILLNGGNKSTQDKDIVKAKQLIKTLE